MAEQTRVHLIRHGEVYNPDGVLYGRLPGFRLSDRGSAQAQAVATVLADRDIVARHRLAAAAGTGDRGADRRPPQPRRSTPTPT